MAVQELRLLPQQLLVRAALHLGSHKQRDGTVSNNWYERSQSYCEQRSARAAARDLVANGSQQCGGYDCSQHLGCLALHLERQRVIDDSLQVVDHLRARQVVRARDESRLHQLGQLGESL
eukprot:2799609-Prymnesium_polylepis.1